jgi:hypothetical protein
MNITVFSKDRACQLEAFLRSYDRHIEYPAPTVIYTHSHPDYRDGYQILAAEYPDVNFVEEGQFKTDVLQSIDPSDPYTVFFVDDIVVRRDFSWDRREMQHFEANPEILALSLRLSPQITYCYALNIPTPIPALDENYTWNWRACKGDWGYPMSVDGHIFRTADILPLLQRLDYRKPNTLEAAIAGHPLNKPKLACVQDHIIVNIPQNVVQTEWKNRAQKGLTAQELNRRFLYGHRIDINMIEKMENNACHCELNYEFIS